MGRDLYRSESTFRTHVDDCCDRLERSLGLDLRSILYPQDGQESAASDKLMQTRFTQPALFVIEYSLAQLWMSWGIQPAAVVGHSVGEFVAACLASVLSLDDALSLVAVRGKLIQALPAGSMLAVSLSAEEVGRHLNSKLSIAAINDPSRCVVSGATNEIDVLARRLTDHGIESRRLHTSHAFHSNMIEPIIAAFAEEVQSCDLSEPRLPILSTVTGTWIESGQIDQPDYWKQNLRQTVRFSDCASELLRDPKRVLLEVGPGNTLSTLTRRQSNRANEQTILSCMRHPDESTSDVAVMLRTLGRLWVAKVEPDWQQFYRHEVRRRVPLPTYPFQRLRYWIDANETTTPPTLHPYAPNDLPALPQKKNDISDWFYTTGWVQKPQASPADLNESGAIWLVFTDPCGLAQRLRTELNKRNQTVVMVTPGARFTKTKDDAYVIDPQEENDYSRLLSELIEHNLTPTKVVHAWRVTDHAGSPGSLQCIDQCQNLGIHSLLSLSRAIGKHCIDQPIEMAVITNNLFNVTGEESLCPEKATVLGPCKVIPLEYPNVRCRHVDMDISDAPQAALTVHVENLLTEISTAPSEASVAYRSGQRWVRVYTPLRMDKRFESMRRLREGGTYLIAGGLGGIGLEVAKFLARQVNANLVLTTRSTFPPRECWDELLASGTDCQQTRERIERVRQIESLGGHVLVATADVTSLEHMRAAVAQAEAQFGPIHGVIHSAGVADNSGSIQRRSREMTEATLASKVRGTLVLEEVLRDSRLDFFILFSSMASVLYRNRFGQVSYVAGNGFLDAFADYRHREGHTPTITLNWDDWQEVGMSMKAAQQFAETYGYQGELFDPLDSFTPADGEVVFHRVLNAESSRVLVSTRDLLLRLAHDVDAESPFLKAAGSAKLTKVRSRPSQSVPTSDTSSGNTVEQTIAEMWQRILGVSRVGLDDDFFDLGGDSLIAVQMFTELEERYGQRFQFATLIEAATPRKLAGHLTVDRPIARWSPLVAVQSHGTQLPLFCIHAADGNVLLYRALARRLGNNQPVYGLQSPGLNGELPGDLTTMAARYLSEIRRVQPDGPYMLAGYCLGGTIALEVAQQLWAQGQTVSLLALLETYDWKRSNFGKETIWENVQYNAQKIEFHVRNFLLAPTAKEKLEFLSEKARVSLSRNSLWARLKSGFSRRQPADARLSQAELWQLHDEVAAQYEFETYRGRITHFVAKKEYRRFRGLGFDRPGGGGVSTHRLPVYPAAMMVEPFTSILAQRLQECIQSAGTTEKRHLAPRVVVNPALVAISRST